MIEIIADRLQKGDTVEIIAPSDSFLAFSKENRIIAEKRFAGMGLGVTYGKNIDKKGKFEYADIDYRLNDFHKAFENPTTKAIICAVGGYNSNSLLPHIDWDLIRKNPKIFCGMSDITILNNAIYSKTGLITYSGPNYWSFASLKGFDYTVQYFQKCLFSNDPFEVVESLEWSDDNWRRNQKNRNFITNEGWKYVYPGSVEGKIVGGNLTLMVLLAGTEYFPSLKDKILFLEDDYEAVRYEFDAKLEALTQYPDFSTVRGLVFGRMQTPKRFRDKKGISDNDLIALIENKKSLKSLSILMNVDFGHTDPKITFPIGGEVQIAAGNEKSILVTRH